MKQEEPKQETPEQHLELINNNIEEFDKAIELFRQRKSKQETFEEVAERLYPIFMELGNCTIEYDSNEELREAFVEGAKWQQQQNKNLYSEIIDLLERSSSIYYEGCDLDIKYESEKSKIINQLKEII